MSAVAAGVLDLDDAFDEVMSFCLQCRACEAACPSLVPFGRAMEGARAELAATRPTLARRIRHRILGSWIARPRLVAAASRLIALSQRVGAGRWFPGRIGRSLRGMRRLPLMGRGDRWSVRDRSGSADPATAPVAALLVGCVMGPWFGRVHEATVAVLEAAGYRVVVPSGQTCCGALAAHDGAADRAAELAARNAAAFAGVDVIVADAAGCTAHMRAYQDWVEGGAEVAARVRDVVEVVADAIAAGTLRSVTVDDAAATVAVQDPCHHRHALSIVEPARVIVRAAGLEPVEIDPEGLCCGAAGVYSLMRPEASRELGRRKAEQVRLTGAATVASANPGCEMQLRAYVGGDVRVAHPVELYAEAVGLIE
jgi:glycolate oxidase iron-sulfur subunit